MNFLQLILNYSWEEINPVFIAKLIIDLVALTVLVRYIYLKHHHRTDLMLTFYSFNAIVFIISYLLNRVELSTGAAFGLFAIDLPTEFAVGGGVGGDVGAGVLIDLEDEEIAGEDGGGAEALDVIGGRDGDAPAEFAG